MTFDETVASLTQVGLDWHRETILRNSFRNAAHVKRTIRDIDACNKPVLVISAGPSLYREKILARIAANSSRSLQTYMQYPFTTVATDGAYIQCLKAGITPDWVITLDPHPTRMVRWFGDPDLEENLNGDDYFSRTNPDLPFAVSAAEENTKNIALVDAHKSNLAICTTAPSNVVERTREFRRYWFAPLVDAPRQGSLTSIMAAATGCPALNTGGTVGTAAWVFARNVLRSKNVALVGADYSYYDDLALEHTQEWNMLKDHENVADLFPLIDGHWGRCRTSPTYFFYAQNFYSLLEANDARVTNCSGHGILRHANIHCCELEQWLNG